MPERRLLSRWKPDEALHKQQLPVRTWGLASRCMRCGWKINLLVPSWNGYDGTQASKQRIYEEGKHREITTQVISVSVRNPINRMVFPRWPTRSEITGFPRLVRHLGKTWSHVTQFTCSRHLLPVLENLACPPGSVKYPSRWRALCLCQNAFISIT